MMAPNPEAGRRAAPLKTAYHVGVLVVLAVVLVGVLQQSLGTPTQAAVEVTEGTGGPLVPERDETFAVRSLTCFTCHNYNTYWDGGEDQFPHELHYDFLDMLDRPDCHACHTFENHAPVINRELCAECH